MNGGPYRAPQPPDRRVINRELPVSRQTDEQPQVVKDEPRPSRRADSAKKSESRKDVSSRRPNWLVILLLLVAVTILGWLAWSKIQAPTTAIDGGKYQVVFLTNGQFYFGKLEPMNSQYMKLTKVYYMQTEKSEQATTENSEDVTADNSNYKLIKLGSEIHGPEDAMMISNEHILYYENLKPDGRVAQLIKQDSAN